MPAPASSVDADPKGYRLSSVAFAFLAVVVASAALVTASQAWSRSNDAKETAALGSSSNELTLSEFTIDPTMVEVPLDSTLTAVNGGTVEHNLAVRDTDATTENLQPSDRDQLDLSGLDAGTYELYCTIPGHAEGGMTAMLHLGDGGMGAASDAGTVDPEANAAIDERMAEPTLAFPAETEGVGAQPLEPTVLPDGTKRFDITAEVVDWEVEPGKVVQAFAYNGTVPGPTIHVDVGDHVQVVLDNRLPESTTIHFHGITLPNEMDGVPDINQPPVPPDETFTYDFVAREPAVGMYHSHHHAEHQVPDGLFAAFLIGEMAAPPGVSVSQEIPMVLNDAGVIGLSLNGKSFPATAPIAASLGEWVEIHYFNEGLQAHPMHLHGMPQLVIAKDGYALPRPYQADTVVVAPGERYTVLVHATEPGTWAFHCHILNHAESEQGMFGMVTAFVVS